MSAGGTTSEAVVLGLLSAAFFVGAVVTTRRRGWKYALPLFIGAAFGLMVTLIAAHGIRPEGRT